MFKFLRNFLFVVLTVFSFTACYRDSPTPTIQKGADDKKDDDKKDDDKKDDDKEEDKGDPNKVGTLDIKFDNKMFGDDLEYNKEYTNSFGTKYKIDIANYFISNIKLKKSDGTEFVYPKDACYFFIVGDKTERQMINLVDVPEDNYTAITFNVGVDSLQNIAPAKDRKGDLAPGANPYVQFWSWNTGYVFYQIEGSYIDDNNNNEWFTFHIGLYGGYDEANRTDNNNRWVTLPLDNNKLKVRNDAKIMLHVNHNMEKMLDGNNKIDLNINDTDHGSAWAKTMADNYKDAFSVSEVHNHASTNN